MAINFPDSPVNGDTHVVGNVTYVYDNAKAKWNGAGQTPNDRLTEGSNKLEIDSNNNLIYSGGNFAIGTSTANSTLTLYGDSSSSFRISKSGVLAYDHTFDGSSYTIANNNGSSGIDIVFGTKTAGAESLRISSAGQIGLGGTNYGTSGQVITSNGSGSAPTWQDAAGGGGGAMVLISTNTFTSSTASIDFTGISGYSRYQIIFSMETSGAGTLRMRVGIDGTYDTGSNYNVGGGLQTSMQVIGGFSATSKHGEINIMNLNQTERTAVFTSGVGESNDGSSHSYQTSGGGHRTATAQNSITLFGSSGNLSSGVVALYGVKYS